MQHSTNSINWPPEFSELKRLDVILKCGICYDFMNNCMITSCSHTYCSLCIRKFMQYKNHCPTCFEETYETNLRNNRLLDEVISIYTKIRDKLLRASRLASVNVPTKYESKERISETKDLLYSSTRSRTTQGSAEIETIQIKAKNDEQAAVTEQIKPLLKLPQGNDDSVVVNGVKVPGMFTSPNMSSTRPRRPEELTDCPVCEVKVPARNINIHLDSCLALDTLAKSKPKVRRRSPLPKRVYTMMPEKSLKKCLKDYGLIASGDRKTMIARLQRYTVIYNAENDAVNPRPVSELIKQLEREEREEKRPNSIVRNLQSITSRAALPKNDVVAIEKANKVYCDENKASFRKLIEEMRAREGRNIKPLKPINRIYSDDDDPNKASLSSSHVVSLPTTSGCSSSSSSKEFNSSNDVTRSIKNCTTNEPKQSLVITSSDDSDTDILISSDTEDKFLHGKIDWNKTTLETNDEATPESIYDVLTQKPECETILTSENEEGDNGKDKKFIGISDEKSCESLSTDYDDSDGSVFDTSVMKSINQKVPKSNKSSKRGRRRLSLSWNKVNVNHEKKTVNDFAVGDSDQAVGDADVCNKMEEIDGDMRDTNASKENKEINNIEQKGDIVPDHDVSDNPGTALTEGTTSNGGDCDDSTNEILVETSLLNETSVLEHSPDNMEEQEKYLAATPKRRLTRSAKRKILNQEMRFEEVTTTPPTRKKTKRNLSPAYD